MSGQLNELRLQVERLNYDNKEGVITIDILKEQNQDAKNELEELKKSLAELKTTQKDASVEEREKRKQEKMAMMMAKFDTVGFSSSSFYAHLAQPFSNFSKALSPRRMSYFARFWQSLTLSIRRAQSTPSLSRT
jgi:FtsZ-binding cell division protein ZapB